jgi:tRNA A-37 threonylcarbamoyl transferase component Bud32
MMQRQQLLKGKYRVLERLGIGGMAIVHAGVNILTERPVAIKRMCGESADDPIFLARFEREARAVGRIRSDHVVDVIDIDRDDEGAPFIVMDRLWGETLSERLRREGRLAPHIVLQITTQILIGIGDAHRAGVIHRDLKPSNIFLEKETNGDILVKIVDFGISKMRGDDQDELTQDGATLGTFSYMPPEQIRRSSAVGPQADLWAVGVLIYRMLAGRNPFRDDDSLSLLALILESAPIPLVQQCSLPPEVIHLMQPIIDRALEKDVAKRYATADEMSRDILVATDALAGRSIIPAAAFSEPLPPTDADRSAAAVAVTSVSQKSRVPRARIAAICAVAALLAGVGWTAANRVTAQPPTAVAVHPVFVAVTVEPAEATITVDGQQLADNTHIDVTNAGKDAVIAAPGFVSHTVKLPEGGGTLVIALVKEAPPPPPPDDSKIVTPPREKSDAVVVGKPVTIPGPAPIPKKKILPRYTQMNTTAPSATATAADSAHNPSPPAPIGPRY